MANLSTPLVLPSKALGAAGILYGHDPSDPSLANSIRVDATGALVVTTTGGAVPAGTAKASVGSYYTATIPGPGYNVGDILRLTEIIDPGTGTVLSSTWTNMETGAQIAPPVMTNVSFMPQSGLTNLELRASPVAVTDTPVYNELLALNTRMTALLGNTDQVEALITQSNSLLTLLNVYNDQVETLLGGITANVDGLEPLINLLNTYNDQVEPLLTQISDQLPSTLGQKVATASLPVVLASDQTLPLPTGAATEAKQDIQITQLTDLNNSVATEVTLAALELKAATEVTLAALEAKAATESSLVNLITHFPPGIGPYTPAESLSVYVSNAADMGGSAVGAAATSTTNTFLASTTDSTNMPSQWSAGDTLQLVQVLDMTATPPTVTSEAWVNVTTGEVIDGIPPATSDVAINNAGLTDAELRASPVPVVFESPLPPAGTATENVIYTQTLAAITADTATPSQWSVGDTITYNAVYDESFTPPQLLSATYFNETTQQFISPAPTPADIAVIPTTPLTNAELRASAVDVFVVNQTAPVPPVTTDAAYNTTYVAYAAGPGYEPGDVLQQQVIVDDATPPNVISETWINTTTNEVIGVPTSGTIAAAPGGGLTDAQLRAAPVHVIVDNQIAPGGSVTENVTYAETLTTLTTDTSTPSEWTAGDTITYNAVYNNASTPPTLVSETYFNETTGLPITNPPAATDVAVAPTNHLTDAELRAAPVEVFVVNQTAPGGSAANNVTYSETLQALTTDAVAPAEWTAGDTITYNAVYDNANPPNLVSETYFNETTGLPITNPPAASELTVMPTTGLTDAELRATPVEVYVVNPTAPGGSVADNVAYSETLEAVTTDTSTPSEWTAGDTITYNAYYDNAEPPNLVSETYFNETTGQPITNPPAASDLATVVTSGLTDAELRASAIHVIVDNQASPLPSTPAATSYTVESFTYVAVSNDATAPLQYVAGDVLQNIQTIDATANPVNVLSNVWTNLTTGVTLTQVPSATTIAMQSNSPLTDAELRAAPVEVFVVNQTTAPAAASSQVITELYTVITAGTGYAVSETLRRTVVMNVVATPPTITSEKWENVTQGTVLGTAPVTTHIALQPSSTGLTDAELRATPVVVDVLDKPIVTRDLSITRVTGTTASIAAGAKEVSIAVEVGYITIQGEYFPTGYSVAFSADAVTDQLGAIAIDATNGTALVTIIE